MKKVIFKIILYHLFLVADLLAVTSSVLAHPHVFIVNRVDAVFDDQGLGGIRIKWIFDEFFSAMIMEEYDQNHNGALEDREVTLIKKEAFDYLAEHDYFVFIHIDNAPFKVQFVRDFWASVSNGRLCYGFLIPCHVKAIHTPKTMRISVYDPTYYSAIFFAEKQPVALENGSRYRITTRIAQNMKDTYYFGLAHPWELTLSFRLKND